MKQGFFDRLHPHMLPLMLLVAATLAIYVRALGHEFLTNWDDHLYVTGNEAVRGFSPGHVRAAFTRYYVGNYAPLQIVSYMLDYTIWGMRPAGYVLTNILLHGLNGILLYGLLFRLTGERLWAWSGAALFLVHPVQVESVAWISQRKNLLAMCFCLVSFRMYIAWRAKDGTCFYLGSLAAFVSALLAKSVAVVLPPALLLYDHCFIPPERRRGWLLDKLPYAGMAAIVALVALDSQTPEYHGGRAPWYGGGPWNTFLTMLPVLARYLGMLFWPTRLSAVYQPTVRSGIDAAVAGAALLVILLVVIGVLLHRWRRDLFFWYVLFFLGLLPVSQIVPLVTLMNDRYLYFPMLGAAGLFGGLASRAGTLPDGIAKKWIVIPVLSLLALLGWGSFQRAEVWQNAVTLWSDAVAKVPDRLDSWKGLGESYDKRGDLDRAMAAYGRALEIDPFFPEVLNNVAIIHMRRGDLETSRRYLELVTTKHPTYVDGFLSLGRNLHDAGRTEEARGAFMHALQLGPKSVPAMIALGNIELKYGRLAEARTFFSRAQSVAGETIEIAYNLACLEALSGRPDEALNHLEYAVQQGFANMALLRQDSYLASLRSHPRFQALLSVRFSGGTGR